MLVSTAALGLLAPASAQDADGAKLFKPCATCHTIDKGGAKKVGPNLWGIVGAPAAAHEGFKYSKAMTAIAGEPWTPERLDQYLAAPKGFVPGTAMSFAGVKKSEDRAALIAWMGMQSDTPAAAAPAAGGSPAPAAPVEAAATTPAAPSVETTTATAAAPVQGVSETEAQTVTVAPGGAETAPETAPAENGHPPGGVGGVLPPVPQAVAEAEATGTTSVAPPVAGAELVGGPQGEIVQIAPTDPPAETPEEIATIAARLSQLETEIPQMDYERARHHPLHYQPAIATASDSECLACHKEILDHKVTNAPAGLTPENSIAWYQTLATYDQAQSDFHWRHVQSDFAKATMKLTCNFCHKGNDVREESPDMVPWSGPFTAGAKPEFTLRKMVNPSETCLRCHGQMPDPVNIMGLGGPWHEVRADMEDPTSDDPLSANGCLTCHAETFRTNRHNVSYLNAASIEDLAQASSDTCYGCHGGRAWYRTSYPYPRTRWPGMDTETTPDWALGRANRSDLAYQMPGSDPTPETIADDTVTGTGARQVTAEAAAVAPTDAAPPAVAVESATAADQPVAIPDQGAVPPPLQGTEAPRPDGLAPETPGTPGAPADAATPPATPAFDPTAAEEASTGPDVVDVAPPPAVDAGAAPAQPATDAAAPAAAPAN